VTPPDLRPEILFGYVGGGADPGLIAYMVTFLTWLGLCFGALMLWPIRALVRWVRGAKPAPGAPEAASANPAETSQDR
jgi:hypothetical protein